MHGPTGIFWANRTPFSLQVTAKVAPYDVATWIKPYTGTTLATAMWDSMMCHAIMKVGPPPPV